MMPIYEDLPFQIWFVDYIPEEFFTPSDYLLFHVISGAVRVQISENKYDFHEDDLFVVHPGESYMVNESGTYLLCVVRMGFGFILRCCEYERPSFYTEKYGHQLVGNGGDSQKKLTCEKIVSLADVFFSSERLQISKLTYLFYDFVYFFIESYKAENCHDDLLERRAYQIRDFIETSYYLPITLNSLAKALDLTPQYLSVFIKKRFGITFGEYLNGVRLNHAEYDLVHTRETVTQIMYKNGFPNAGRFNESFKKSYGKTPLEYRRLLWGQNNGELPKPPDNAFSQKTLELYHDFLHNRLKTAKLADSGCVLHLDAHRSEYLHHPWCSVLNVGNAATILNIDYYNQLLLMGEHLHFRYARIQHIASCVEKNNFTRIDAVIDAVKKIGMIPWIVIESDLNDPRIDALLFTEKFFDYCLRRYGFSDMRQWIFEISWASAHNLRQYCDQWGQIFRVIRGKIPDISIGGPACSLAMSSEDFERLFQSWKENQCIPDFLSLTAWPVIEKGQKLSSTNINLSRLKSIDEKKKKLLSDSNRTDQGPQLCIVDGGFVPWDHCYLNDSVFMGDYWIKTCIDMEKYVSVIASPPLSDFTQYKKYISGYPDKFLWGGRGLMTTTSIFKPVFFALKYLSQLGERCLHRGENHIVTIKDNSELVILLYNYKYPAPDFCEHPYNVSDLTSLYNIFSDSQPCKFHVRIKNLDYKKYQVTRFNLNKDFGSVLDSWFSFGQIPEIKRNTLNYLRATLWPKASVCELKNDDGLEICETLAPHEIIMLSVIPDN